MTNGWEGRRDISRRPSREAPCKQRRATPWRAGARRVSIATPARSTSSAISTVTSNPRRAARRRRLTGQGPLANARRDPAVRIRRPQTAVVSRNAVTPESHRPPPSAARRAITRRHRGSGSGPRKREALVAGGLCILSSEAGFPRAAPRWRATPPSLAPGAPSRGACIRTRAPAPRTAERARLPPSTPNASRGSDIVWAAGVKKSPYQNRAQTQPQSANAKAFARRKNITPRRLGMGRMQPLGFRHGAQPSGGGAPQSTTVTSAGACRAHLSARIEEREHEAEQPLRAEARRRGAHALAGVGLAPWAACTRCPVAAMPGVRPQNATNTQDQAIASTAASAAHTQAARASASAQSACPRVAASTCAAEHGMQ